MADQAGSSEHSVLCLRLMPLFPRVTRGMRRWQDRVAPVPVPSPLSPRHVAALEQIRGGPLTVGELASRLDLTLPTVSGVLADLDRAGLVERRPDPADRRRTIVQIIPAQATLIGHWLDGAAKPATIKLAQNPKRRHQRASTRIPFSLKSRMLSSLSVSGEHAAAHLDLPHQQ